jgi:putative holliday junction resolvase
MPIVSVSDLRAQRALRLLGLDISRNAIGLSVGDFASELATPIAAIARTRLVSDAAYVTKIICDYGVGGLVVGWPLNMDGTEGPRCQAVRDTVLALEKYLPPLPIAFQDERQTTREALSVVEGTVGKLLKKRGKAVDSHAAMLILSRFLTEDPSFHNE